MRARDASVADAQDKARDRALETSAPAGTGDTVARLLRNDAVSQENNHLYSFFLTNITTEFRTPLAALSASLQYLLGDLENLSANDIRELLASVHLSVTGLQTLIDNLIESTNIEAGHFAIRTGTIDIGDVIAEAADFTSPLFKRRGQQLIVDGPDWLPLICGDPPRLGQVMVNLLSGASKLGQMNQPIYVGLHVCEQRWLWVCVSDQRVEPPPKMTAEPHTYPPQRTAQGDRPYSVELGFSVARSIIEKHGGAFGLEERPAGGSLYWFTVRTVEQRRGRQR
jgi:signal transduction histidine kinase